MVSNVQTDSFFLKCFKVYDQIFITPYAPRIKFITYKDTWDEAGTKFGSFILFVFSNLHIIDFDTKRYQKVFEFLFETQFMWCFTIIPYMGTIAAHGKVPVSLRKTRFMKGSTGSLKDTTKITFRNQIR